MSGRRAAKRSRSGCVYVLTNSSMPGLVKIGWTGRDPETRLRELNAATGVPTPFELRGFVKSRHPQSTEKAVHAALASERVNDKREFFRIGHARAEAVVRKVAREQGLRFRKRTAGIADLIHVGALLAAFNVAAVAALSASGYLSWPAVLTANIAAILLSGRRADAWVAGLRRRALAGYLSLATLSAAVVIAASSDIPIGRLLVAIGG